MTQEDKLIIGSAIEQVKGMLSVLVEHQAIERIPADSLSAFLELALEKTDIIDDVITQKILSREINLNHNCDY